jgi:hypothetical protein
MTESTKNVELNRNGALLCPRCKSEYLHHDRVTVWRLAALPARIFPATLANAVTAWLSVFGARIAEYNPALSLHSRKIKGQRIWRGVWLYLARKARNAFPPVEHVKQIQPHRPRAPSLPADRTRWPMAPIRAVEPVEPAPHRARGAALACLHVSSMAVA